MGILSVNMLGIPSIELDGKAVILPYRKAEALLYYLIMKQKVARSEMIGLLWADSDTSTAQRNLRHAIYTLRKTLGMDIFLSGQRTLLTLDPALPLRSDVNEFMNGGALSLYRGEFLKGFALHQAGYFEDWLTEQRNLFQIQYLKRLLAAQKDALQNGDLSLAEQYGLKHLEIDPLDEDATVTLMRVYAAERQYRKAIELYHRLSQLLSEEFGISPLKSSSQLYYSIVDQWNSSSTGREDRANETLLIGKESALKKLLALCRTPESLGGISSALIEGEAGVGKSCLLNHLLTHFDFSDRLILKSYCYPSEQETAFAPWNSIMLSLMAELGSGKISVSQSVLRAASSLFPCLSVDSHADIEPAGHYALHPNYQASLESVILLLSVISQHNPLLLVFEDIHWMDTGSASLLGLLLRRLRAPQLTVLCTARTIVPEHISRLIRTVEQDKLMERLLLKNFNRSETERFIRASLSDYSADRQLNDIYRATEGNALLLVQLVNSYLEGAEPDKVPDDLEKLMDYRLANLSPDERKVLDLISVFTDWAKLDTLTAILTMGTLELTYTCHQLCQRMLLQESLKNGELSYALAHEKIKSILVRQQSESARRILHLRVAQQMELQLSAHRTPVYDRLIYHLSEGGDKINVFRYRVLALNAYTGLTYALLPTLRELSDDENPRTEDPLHTDSLSLSDYIHTLEKELAALRLNTARNSILDSSELILLHSKSRCCIYGGNYREGLPTIEQLIERATALQDTDMLVRAHLQYIYYGIQIYDRKVMETHLKAEQALLTGRRLSVEYGVYLRLSGLLKLMYARYREARELLDESVQLFQALDSDGHMQYEIHIAGAYNYIAESYRLEGNYKAAFDYYDKAIRHNRSLGYYPGTAVFFTNCGVAAFQSGDRTRARLQFEHARRIYTSSHEYSGYPIALSYLAFFAAEAGNYHEAASKLREAHKISDRMGSPWWKGIALFLSWRIRMLPALSQEAPEELHALWPADPAEHCRLCLSYLKQMQPIPETSEIENALKQLTNDLPS